MKRDPIEGGISIKRHDTDGRITAKKETLKVDEEEALKPAKEETLKFGKEYTRIPDENRGR